VKAAILYGKGQIKIENVPPRPLQSGEVRIDIQAALTCGTDLKVFKRGYHAKMIVPPAPFGHELAGVISEVATDSSGWQPGDHVAVANSAPCGECFYCRQGRENLCDDLLFLNGAYAESIVVPERLVRKNLLRLKAGTAFRDAALVEPLACVAQGVEDLKLRAGQCVLVLGSGPIGLMFVAVARHLGCDVALAGRGKPRLQAARRLGASPVIDVGVSPDVVQAVRNSAAMEFDAVVEAVGKVETWEAAVQLVRKGGVVNFFGGCPAGAAIALDTSRVHYSSLRLLASFHHAPRTIRRAMELIEQGVIRAEDFVEAECPLSQLPELFASMASGSRPLKTLIRVRE
jgi:L-iditol 2-dehydrogenase